MSSHSIAEAKERLPDLVERALRGEPVAITHDGQPAAALRPVQSLAVTEPGQTPAGSLAWLRRHRLGRLHGETPDAGQRASLMRAGECD